MMSVGQKIKTGVIGNDVVTALDGYPDELAQAKIWIMPTAQNMTSGGRALFHEGKAVQNPRVKVSLVCSRNPREVHLAEVW